MIVSSNHSTLIVVPLGAHAPLQLHRVTLERRASFQDTGIVGKSATGRACKAVLALQVADEIEHFLSNLRGGPLQFSLISSSIVMAALLAFKSTTQNGRGLPQRTPSHSSLLRKPHRQAGALVETWGRPVEAGSGLVAARRLGRRCNCGGLRGRRQNSGAGDRHRARRRGGT